MVFVGPACSGKSTLAARLSVARGIPHLEMDTTRARILPDSSHSRADRAVAYRAMHFAAEMLLRSGAGVILDAPYGHPEDRAEIEEIARRTGASMFVIECRVSPATAVRRFRARGPDSIRLDLTGERVEQIVRSFSYSGRGLLLETDTMGVEQCLSRVEAYLASGPALTRLE